MSNFEDSEKWGPGAQSAIGRQRASDGPTTHGGHALERMLYGKIKFRESHLDMIAMAQRDLELDELQAVKFLRAASYVLVQRFTAACEGADELPGKTMLGKLQTVARLYKLWDDALKTLEAADNNVIDYEDMLNDNG